MIQRNVHSTAIYFGGASNSFLTGSASNAETFTLHKTKTENTKLT